MKPRNILIVEDEVLIATILEKYLLQSGYQCAGIALDGQEAIQILKTNSVDLVLLDVNISGTLNGIGLARLINKNYGLPFIFITSYRDETTIEEILSTNPQAYISKPVDQLQLKTSLSIYFAREIENNFKFKAGNEHYLLNLDSLIYAKTDHVYLELYFEKETKLLRSSLSHLLDELPSKKLIRLNRSIAVNPMFITKIEKRKLWIGELEFSISQRYFPDFENLIL